MCVRVCGEYIIVDLTLTEPESGKHYAAAELKSTKGSLICYTLATDANGAEPTCAAGPACGSESQTMSKTDANAGKYVPLTLGTADNTIKAVACDQYGQATDMVTKTYTPGTLAMVG